MVVAREVAKRYGDQGIISISLNPGEPCGTLGSAGHAHYVTDVIGNIQTELQRYAPSFLRKILVGAETIPQLFIHE